ncbi:MAG: hypothetical protein HY863_08065 [Chloroflexi bacterium]|nr:hypothetical protein [Chloroflexota bacterium]
MSTITSILKNRAIMASLIVLFLLAVIAAGFSTYRYLADSNNYEKGHQAYLQADCKTAIGLFDKIINSSRLINFGQCPQRAQLEKDECLVFQNAADLESSGNLSSALVAYLDFIIKNGKSPLVETTRIGIASLFQAEKIPLIASEASCTQTGALLERNLIPNPETNLPLFYLACGQAYEKVNQPKFASAMYQWILISYPENPVSLSAETALLENQLTCQESETIRQSAVANRTDFMPKLYYGCGQKYEVNTDYANARKMYETFLAAFPEHSLAKEVESALARTIVAQAKASGAGEISQPESSGSTTSGVVQVIIQNDSPDRMRITFSGPSSQVEELEACSTCTSYEVAQAPLFCPELGPIGQYTLPPGVYDIVVESISDDAVTPWIGNWDLVDGNEYHRCFFITTELK